SLYDGATAVVEAVNLARSVTGRGRVLVSGAVDDRFVKVLRAYGRGAGYEPEVFPVPDGTGGTPEVADDVAAVIVQHPNVFGELEPVRELFGTAHDAGARAIQIFDPLSLGVLAPPGELGADVAVAKARYAAARLSSVDGVSLLHPDAPFFKEFALRLPRSAAEVRESLLDRGVLAGVPLAQTGENVLLVAVTERRTRAQIDAYAEALAEVLR